MVVLQVSSILLGIHDPFAPFENIFCALFMGGLADAISRAFGAKVAGESEKSGGESKQAAEKKKE